MLTPSPASTMVVLSVSWASCPRTAPAKYLHGLRHGPASAGSTVFAPLMQTLAAPGLLGTMVFLSLPILLLFPVSLYLCRPAESGRTAERGPVRMAALALSVCGVAAMLGAVASG